MAIKKAKPQKLDLLLLYRNILINHFTKNRVSCFFGIYKNDKIYIGIIDAQIIYGFSFFKCSSILCTAPFTMKYKSLVKSLSYRVFFSKERHTLIQHSKSIFSSRRAYSFAHYNINSA